MLTVKPVYKHLNVSDDLKWTDGSLPKAMPVYKVLFLFSTQAKVMIASVFGVDHTLCFSVPGICECIQHNLGRPLANVLHLL